MGEECFTDFKSSNEIEISWLVQVLSNFNWFQGSPRGVADGWMVVGVDMGVWGGCPMHACMHTCTHMHVKHDQHGCLHVSGHLQFLYMYTCACMHMHVGTPPCPQMSPHTPTHLPPPRATESPKHQNSITLERIEIIQFCLKIWDHWTLLHTYRLGLMCRWGVSYSKWHFYVFDPKKCSCDPPIKKFPIFALDPIRPYLDWALRGFLTS